jgi:hypothetical protein
VLLFDRVFRDDFEPLFGCRVLVHSSTSGLRVEGFLREDFERVIGIVDSL